MNVSIWNGPTPARLCHEQVPDVARMVRHPGLLDLVTELPQPQARTSRRATLLWHINAERFLDAERTPAGELGGREGGGTVRIGPKQWVS